MIKAIAFLLLTANLAYFAWHQGHLQMWGLGPAATREPQRIEQQIKAETLKLLKPEEAKKLEAAAAKPLECYLSPNLSDAQANALRGGLPALIGSNNWQIDAAVEPARWIVYMGKYPSAEAVARKKVELRALSVNFETLRRTDLEPGLSLGSAATRDGALALLADAVRRGVRTGRALEEKPETQVQRLKLPAVDEALRAKLAEIKTLGGVTQFSSCK